jgi:hypothetical protein
LHLSATDPVTLPNSSASSAPFAASKAFFERLSAQVGFGFDSFLPHFLHQTRRGSSGTVNIYDTHFLGKPMKVCSSGVRACAPKLIPTRQLERTPDKIVFLIKFGFPSAFGEVHDQGVEAIPDSFALGSRGSGFPIRACPAERMHG